MDKLLMEWLNGVEYIVLPDGRRLPLIKGGQEDDENDPGTGGSGGSDENDDDDEEEEQEEEELKDPKAKIKALEDQIARRARKDKRKDRVIEDLQKQVAELQNKDKSPDEKTLQELESFREKTPALEKQVDELRAYILLLEHDDLVGLSKSRRKAIMRIASGDVEIDEDGDSNVDEVLKAIKEDEPYLFEKPQADEEEEENDNGSGPKKQRRVQRRSEEERKAKTTEFQKRFPALRGRPVQ